MVCQIKIIQINTNLLADLFIHQTFCQMLENNKFAKLSPYTSFPAIQYTIKVESLAGGKFDKSTLFKHSEKKFGELIDHPKGY